MSGVRIRNGRENTKIVPDVERVLEGTIYKRYCGRDYRGNHCIAIVDCVSTGIRREPGTGNLYCDCGRICYSNAWRKPGADIWSDSSICDDCSRDCRTERNGRSCRSDNSCRSDFDPDGSL